MPNQFVTTSLRLDRKLLDDLREVAAANRRSVSQEIRWVLDRHIAEHKRQQKEAVA
jgi:hypothetical protein